MENFMKKLLQLDFNKEGDSFLVVESVRNLKDITLTTWVDIVYEGSQFFRLKHDESMHALEYGLLEALQKALRKELVLDESINKNLGYMLMQDYKKSDRKNFVYVDDGEGGKNWIGTNYCLYGSGYRYRQNTWLYNNRDGNIIFEITPSYPWIYNDPEEGEVFEKYSDWMKSYKPYVKRQIPHKTAERWVKQLEHLMETIRENDDRLTCRGPNCQMCKEEGVQLYKQSSPNACDHQSCYDKKLELLGKLKK